MSTEVLMGVDEHLHTSFEHDCDYVDGDDEKAVPEIPHSDVQGNTYRQLWRYRPTMIENSIIPLEKAFDLTA
jgi:hypothetical protein